MAPNPRPPVGTVARTSREQHRRTQQAQLDGAIHQDLGDGIDR